MKEMWRQMSTLQTPTVLRGGERQGIGGRTKPHWVTATRISPLFPATEARVKGSTSGFWRAVLEQPGEGGGMKAEGLCNNSGNRALLSPNWLLSGHGT